MDCKNSAMLRYAQLCIELRDIQRNYADDPEPLTEFLSRVKSSRSLLTVSEVALVDALVASSGLCLNCHYASQRIIFGEVSGQLHLEAVCSDSCAQALLENSTEDEEYCVGCDCFND